MSGAYHTSNATVSAHGAFVVTPSDSTVFQISRALYIGTAGNLAVRTADAQTITFVAVSAGILPIQVDMVMLTNTTAANVLALY